MDIAPQAVVSPISTPDRSPGPGSKVLVTGGSGFVGRYVVRELLASGYTPVCLVREPDKMRSLLSPAEAARAVIEPGDLSDFASLERAAKACAAAIHLVGIITEKPSAGVTFERVHVDGTRHITAACLKADIRRYVHMSALGVRADAPTGYQRTKWAAEEIVRSSGLDWTIFRPSLIHGPDGEFMRMMTFFSKSRVRLPFMPYFGDGKTRVQPVYVRDVATCFVKALTLPATKHQSYDLCGPERFTWKQLYDVCALAITGRRRLKLPVPVLAARLAAKTVVPLMPSFLVPFKFDEGQVLMSQEDSICDIRPIEETFGIRLRDFREELSHYASRL